MNRQAVQTLKTYFGYDTFREGQESVVESILEHRDVACNHADRSRKIHLLSGTGVDNAWDHNCDFSIDIIDAGSGKGFE